MYISDVVKKGKTSPTAVCLFMPKKIKLYRHVQAIVKYGSHAWKLTPDVRAKLNGWNARRECIILGNYPVSSWRVETDRGGNSRIVTTTPAEQNQANPRQRQQATDLAVDIVKAIEREQ